MVTSQTNCRTSGWCCTKRLTPAVQLALLHKRWHVGLLTATTWCRRAASMVVTGWQGPCATSQRKPWMQEQQLMQNQTCTSLMLLRNLCSGTLYCGRPTHRCYMFTPYEGKWHLFGCLVLAAICPSCCTPSGYITLSIHKTLSKVQIVEPHVLPARWLAAASAEGTDVPGC